MLVLFETAAGYAIFKLLDESKLKKVESIWDEFSVSSSAKESLQLVTFKQFKDVDDALTNVTSVHDGKLGKVLKKILKSKIIEEESLIVGDSKLAGLIKENATGIKCLYNSATAELMRGIRSSADDLLSDYSSQLSAMRLALAHSLGRYKVKFNPEKIDTMIIQAVLLLDDLDKELNNYVMRCREWYGWHFPELGKIIQDPVPYAKTLKAIGKKQNAAKADLSEILPEEMAARVKEEAEMSMGTDIADLDIIHILELCDQIIEIFDYRSQLHEYLKNRMHALAPNLTVLLGELVGARLVSKAGSLVGLAKYPASTVQILGAEKALFRALKTKTDTPKYGIIYHAQLIGQTATKLKGKVSRKLAAKVSLAARIDALCEDSPGNAMGIASRAYLEGVIKSEQERGPKRFSGIKQAPSDAYTFKKEIHEYDTKLDLDLKKEEPIDSEEGPVLEDIISRGYQDIIAKQENVSEKPVVQKKTGKKRALSSGTSGDLDVDETVETHHAEVSKPSKKKKKRTQ